jgi:hypothetical protein
MSAPLQTFATTADADNRSEPGAVYEWEHTYRCDWDNCSGTHVTVILPTGDSWCPDRRASNCGSPDDRTHRCWVRHGPLDRLTVDKNGDTCIAGAGSIQTYESKIMVDDEEVVLRQAWHGFLHDGVLA